MKILQVNCVYKQGSTGKIVYDLHSEFQKNGMESVVCYGRGDIVRDQNVYKTCGELYSKLNNMLSRITGIMYAGCVLSTQKLIKIIKKEKPDIVHLHCINGYFVNIYRIVKYLRVNGIKTVLTLHAEFMFTGGCGYAIECTQWMKPLGCGYPKCPRWRTETGSLFVDRTASMWKYMKEAFCGFDNLTVVSVSPWLMNRAQKSVIFSGKKNITIFNGIDTKIFYPRDVKSKKEKWDLRDKKILFHVTASFKRDKTHIKGGYYILELAKRLKNENVVILVAGGHEDIPDAPDNLIFLGKIYDQKELADYYSIADLTVLTSKRETFSMVTVESLCCGTPIVGFCAGGPESIAIKEYSIFVPHGDIEALYKAVQMELTMGKSREISEKATKMYSKQKMAQDYKKCYEELLRRGKW